MNKEILKGNWNQLKGKVQQKWGKLTDDDMATMNGSYEQLLGKIQERYGYDKQRIETELNDFFGKENQL